jgi:hypothetical protein
MIAAETMIEWGNAKIGELTGFAQNGVALAAIAIIALTYVGTRNLIKTAVAGVVAGLVLFSVANVGWFKDRVGGEFNTTPSGLVSPTPPAAS